MIYIHRSVNKFVKLFIDNSPVHNVNFLTRSNILYYMFNSYGLSLCLSDVTLNTTYLYNINNIYKQKR